MKMKKMIPLMALLLGLAAPSLRAEFKIPAKVKKPVLADVTGVVKIMNNNTLTVLTTEAGKLGEKSFALGQWTQVKGAKSKGFGDLTPGKAVKVVYDADSAKKTAQVVIVLEKGEEEKKKEEPAQTGKE